jgi:hypothetical protein
MFAAYRNFYGNTAFNIWSQTAGRQRHGRNCAVRRHELPGIVFNAFIPYAKIR